MSLASFMTVTMTELKIFLSETSVSLSHGIFNLVQIFSYHLLSAIPVLSLIYFSHIYKIQCNLLRAFHFAVFKSSVGFIKLLPKRKLVLVTL